MKLKTKFTKLTAAQKRVAIAKDVIKQVQARAVKVTPGVNIRNNAMLGMVLNQRVLLSEKPVCEACAAGCAIISGIRLFNDVEIQANSGAVDLMGHWFPAREIGLIECAFERYSNFPLGRHSKASRKMKGRAIAFGEKHDNADKRAVAIFKNIIANNGTFKP